jgi:hypothetical protein
MIPPIVVYLIGSAFMLVLGLSMLFAPGRFQRDRAADYDRRLAKRLERGHDAYFEELRTLEAYRKPYHESSIRFFGGVLAILSVLTVVLRLAAR